MSYYIKCHNNIHDRVQYNDRPFSNQVTLLTDQCSHWLAICANQFFYDRNSLLLVFITCIIIVIIIIVVSLPFLIEAI